MAARKKNPHIGEDLNGWIREETGKDPVLADMVEQDLKELQIATRLREQRLKLGMSQGELARIVNTKQPAISRIETGQHNNIQIATLDRVARALGFKLEIALRRSPAEKSVGCGKAELRVAAKRSKKHTVR